MLFLIVRLFCKTSKANRLADPEGKRPNPGEIILFDLLKIGYNNDSKS
jgi:hypothetical protein